MEVFKTIGRGIISDELSLYVFLILASLFLIEMALYFIIWINLVFLNNRVKNGLIYKQPLKKIIEGFEELLKISTHQVNTRAFIEDFFSLYRAIVIPMPILDNLKIPVISAIKFIKNTVSLFILVGVLGTFVGIYTSLVSLLNVDGSGSILTGLESIAPVLSGMGTAFATSIAGMGFALLTTFIIKLFNAEQFLIGIMARLENYLDNEIKIASRSFMARSFQNIDQTIERGFARMDSNGEKIYGALKGFEGFSEQFKEAATHMENFNTNLAGSMGDLKEFYQTNKEFTEGFSSEIRSLTDRFENLTGSIDQLNKQQERFKEFLFGINESQKTGLEVLQALQQEVSTTQQQIVAKSNHVLDRFQKDTFKMEHILGIIDKTVQEQERVSAGYQEVVLSIAAVREDLTDSFTSNVNYLNQSLEELKRSYNSEMSKNIKTFAEHVSLSNNIINKGFDSLVNKFENMDLILGKYLSGLAFNANDLEGTIGDLNRSVKSIEDNIKEHNRSIRSLQEVIENANRE